MAIKNLETLTLLDRFDYLSNKYVHLIAELAPLVEKVGKYKQELQLIACELKERGVSPSSAKELEEILLKLIKERELSSENERPDQT